jgi:hypothetical protein
MLGDDEPKTNNTATRLDVYKVLVAAAKSYGRTTRPTDIQITDRIEIVLHFLYPKGIPKNIDFDNKELKDVIVKFTHNCEKRYTNCRRNMTWVCQKHQAWLDFPFYLTISNLDQMIENPTPNEASVGQDHEMTQTVTTNAPPAEICNSLSDPITSVQQETNDCKNAPSTSIFIQNQINRQKRQPHGNIENTLEEQPPSKLAKIISNVVTDNEKGAKLSKSCV